MKQIRKIIIFLLPIFFLCTDSLFGNQNATFLLSLKDELSGSSVHRIYKDNTGFVWFATSGGIDRFDGINIKSYKPSDTELWKRSINDITETASGDIIAGSQGGLWKIDNNTDEIIRLFPEQIPSIVQTVCAIENNLLIGTERGLFYFNADRQTLNQYLPDKNIMSDNNIIKDIIPGVGNKIWLTTPKSIALFDLDTSAFEIYEPEVAMNMVGEFRCMTLLNTFLYIGTENEGIIYFDISKKTFDRYISVNCNVVTEISTDNVDLLYVATNGNGAHVISQKQNKIVATYKHKPDKLGSLRDNALYCFLYDRDGVYWFGQAFTGISYSTYTSPLFQRYRLPDFDTFGLSVRSVCFDDKNHTMLIGTRDGLYYLHNEKLLRYYGSDKLGSNIITCVEKYDDVYFIGTYGGGLSLLNPNTLEIKRLFTEPTFTKSNFTTIVISPDDKLWMGTSEGIYVYDKNTKEIITFNSKNSQLPEGIVHSIHFDVSGKAWIATRKGLSVYDSSSKSIKSDAFPPGFPNKKAFYYITTNNEGKILFLSFDEIYVTNPDLTGLHQIKLSEEITSESYAALYQDIDSYYWLTTEASLYRFDSTFTNYRRFGYSDNLPALVFNKSPFHFDAAGKLWLGNRKGLLYIHPQEVNKQYTSQEFPIILSSVLIDGKEPMEHTKQAFISKKEIILHTNQTLSLRPVLLNFANPIGRKYEYMVDRVDDGWKITEEWNPIYYTTLPSGQYTLKIRVFGNTAFYDTWNLTVKRNINMAYVLLVVTCFLLGFIALYYYIIIRKKRAIDKRLLSTAGNTDSKEFDVEKYKVSRIKEEEIENIRAALIQYIEKEKPYLNPGLKMSSIASAIGYSSHKLSQVFTLYYKQSYYDFINLYRLEEFKQRVENPEYSKYTISALAELCGFNRSSFFSTFKKEMGITPNEYLQKRGLKL